MKQVYNFRLLYAMGHTAYLTIVAVFGLVATVVKYYLDASDEREIFQITIGWIVAFIMSLFVHRVVALIVVHSGRNKSLFVLPYLILASAMVFPLFKIIMGDKNISSEHIYIISSVNTVLYLIVPITLIRQLRFTNIPDLHTSKSGTPLIEDVERHGLGGGDSVLDKSINSIVIRAVSAGRMVVFSLIAMSVILIIGVGASIGTLALDQAKKTRELESERQKMLKTVVSFAAMKVGTESKTKQEILEIIQAKYGDQDSYEDLIKSVEERSKVSWPDIIMRITIAALTLFLVQIFFQIYKYSQQQSAHLYGRAEVMELYKDTSDQNELRTKLFTMTDSNPTFGRAPTSPTEQLLSFLMKSKESK